MAKKKQQVEPAEPPPVFVAEERPPAEIPIAVAATRWTVRLSCPTPLAFSELTVEAETESQAKSAFDAANGIGGSSHPYTITKA